MFIFGFEQQQNTYTFTFDKHITILLSELDSLRLISLATIIQKN